MYMLSLLSILPFTAPACGSAQGGGEAPEAPKVYFVRDITPENMVRLYEALERPATGKVAVKLSTGEPGGHNFLKPELIKDLVQKVDDTIVECNTAYGGGRASTENHLKAAADHGFTAIADVDIQDEEGSMALPVAKGFRLKENYVGTHFANYDSYLVLSHFKGHAMGGFGGSMKNIAIGCADGREGKTQVHGVDVDHQPEDWNAWPGKELLMENMAESAKATIDFFGKHIVFINVMRRMSVDCDCAGLAAAEPTIPDIGICASTDILAVDQACVDMVYSQESNHDLVERMESRHGLHQLTAMRELKMGSDKYELISIDED